MKDRKRIGISPRVIKQEEFELLVKACGDEAMLKYVGDKGSYVQIRNGVRVLMVPKDDTPGNKK